MMDDLSREELITKCKHYLSLAQKAKQAKDEALKKLDDLDAELKKCQNADKKTSANETETRSGADVDILEAQLESCERRISRLSDENEKLLVKLDASELKCKQLEGELKNTSKKDEIAELRLQNQKLQEKLEEANSTRKAVVKKLEEVSIETRQLIENSEQLSDDNELLKKQVTTLQDSKKNNEYEIEKLKEKVAKLLVADELTKEENGRLGSAVDTLKKQILEKSKEIEHLTSKSLELAQKNEYISALSTEIETLKKCNESLQQELGSPCPLDSDKNTLLAENETLRNKLVFAFDSVTSLKQKVENLKGTVISELSALLSQNEARDKDLQAAKAHLSSIKNTKIVSLKQKVSNLHWKYKKLAEENSRLNIALSEKTALSEEFLVDKNEISKTLENIKEEVSKLKCDKDRLELENGQLKGESETIVVSKEDLIKSAEKCKKLEEEKSLLAGENMELSKKLDSLHSDFVKIQDKCNELDKKATDMNNQNAESFQKEISALNKEKLELEKNLDKLKSSESELSAEMANLIAQNKELLNEKHLFESTEKQMVCNIQNLTEENEKLKAQNCDFESCRDKLNCEIVELTEKIDAIRKERDNFASENERIHLTLKKLQENFDQTNLSHQRGILQLKNQIRSLEKENSELMSCKEENESQNERLKMQEIELKKLRGSVEENENVKKKLNDCINLINQLEGKNLKMQSSLEKMQSADLNKTSVAVEQKKESAAIILRKVEEFQRLRRDLKDFVQASFQDLSTFSSFVNQDIMNKVNALVENKNMHMVAMKRDHAELLSEMQEMVTILKQRGEFISKLEQKLSQKNEEIKEVTSSFTSRVEQLEQEISILLAEVDSERSSKTSLEESLVKCEKQLTTIQQELEGKNVIIDQLKTELSKLESSLKEKDELIVSHEQDLSRLRDFQENDTLSTSTISRTEEANRLKDIEESFEDRYAKLKVVAVKLKKKCNDLTRQLEAERNKVVEESELQQKVQQLTAKLKNTQCLQQELDKAYDNVELYQKDLKAMQKKLDEEKHDKIKISEELETVKLELNNKVGEITNLLKEKNALKTSVDALSNQIEVLQKEKRAAEMVSQQKEKEVNKMREKLVEKEKEMIAQRQQLEEAFGVSKKQSILNLELQDYEKTVSDLTQQLNVEKCHVKNLQDELQEAQKAKKTLDDQIGTMETQISFERSKSIKIAENLSLTESKLSEVEGSIKKFKDEISMITSNLEKEKCHSEDLSLQLAEVSSEFTQFKNSSIAKERSLVEQINTLTAQLDKTRKLLHESQEECETMKSEFQAYKIRVHSVLEKHKKENTNQKEEEVMRIRLEQLEESNKALKLQLENVSVDLDTAKFNLNKALSEKESCDKGLKEARTTLSKKNKELDEVKNELKAFKVKTDLLISCHKSQMEEARLKYETELQTLRGRISALEIESSKIEQDAMKTSSDSLKQSNPDFEFSATREEGEGSENTDITPLSYNLPHPRKQTIMPLEQLLEASDLNSENEVVQIDELKHDLATYQSQVQHLSALLNESEKNNARNEQLNSFLKEEIRRLERSLERQPHITNSEYLKNVIFKFITLQSGDERSRLVPVLDTILKLSPDESKKLSAVASGTAETPAGWNFLSW
nr:PREDICTED: GRIP and coiled-coil domain-containing protein 2 [Bemisia tabaci]